MGRLFTISFVVLLNLYLGGCDKNVNWESLPQVKSIATMAHDRAWLVTLKGDLLRTEDAGATWQKTPAEIVGGFQSATMLDARRGFTVSNRGRVWSTDDAGRTWVAKAELKSEDWHFNESKQIQFTDELHGWIIETLTIWRTADGGTNWQRAFSPFEQKANGQPVRAFFLNSRHIWICGTQGEVYSTKDGGNTWTIQAVAGKDLTFTDLFFVNSETGWLAGYASGRFNNRLYHTSDGGKTWRLAPTAFNQGYLNSIYFLNEREGWACGDGWLGDANADSGKGILLHTADGGQSWQSVFISDDEPFFDRVWFVDQQHGWLFGRDSVYKTKDGGQNWHPVLKLPSIKNAP